MAFNERLLERMWSMETIVDLVVLMFIGIVCITPAILLAHRIKEMMAIGKEKKRHE